jgi:alkylhydroperoxidase family enzyme
VLGLGDEQLVAAVLADWRTAPVNEKVRATLGFLEKVTLSPSEVGPEDVEPLRAVGVSEQAIQEALYVGFLFNVMNRLADAFDFYFPSAQGFKQHRRLLYTVGYRTASILG